MNQHSFARGQGNKATPQTTAQNTRQPLARGFVSLLLNAVAGWVDAVGYLALLASIQMFPSFMSGNLTKIVTDAVSGEAMKSWMIAGAVLAFFIGAVVGRLVNAGKARRDPLSLALVAGVLAFSAVNLELGGFEYVTLLALAASMGMINHAFSGHMQFHVHTFLSGVWLTLAAAVADLIAGRAGWREALAPAMTLLSVLTGAFTGALAVTYAPLAVSIFMPTAVILLVVIALLAGRAKLDDANE